MENKVGFLFSAIDELVKSRMEYQVDCINSKKKIKKSVMDEYDKARTAILRVANMLD